MSVVDAASFPPSARAESVRLPLGALPLSMFAASILLSAFLLFLVQPIVAKQILPWFGGSAVVWTTCLVFFQVTLLAGYAYSDWLSRRSTSLQRWVHLGLLAASLACLPIVPSAGLRPLDGDSPAWRILVLLTLTIGLPYFALSTTGPLLQSWLGRAVPSSRVYRLYAVSNVGSLLGLLAYPFAIEPRSTIGQQAFAWSAAYAVFAVAVAGCALVSRSWKPVAAEASTGGAAPSWRQASAWFLLAAGSSTLLLAVTAHVTQNIASVPLLWVAPLGIYLLSFVLCFDGKAWYRPRLFRALMLVAGPLLVFGLSYRFSATTGVERGLMPIKEALALYLVAFFVICMFCHGELAARKPAPRWLTRYYLMMSLGGAAGGLAVGIVAPLLLHASFELPLALCVLAAGAALLQRGWPRHAALASLLACAVGATLYVRDTWDEALLLHRDFYGTMRVTRAGSTETNNLMWSLMHGSIMHGQQVRVERWRRMPTSYYGEKSGVGRAIDAMRQVHEGPQRIGLIGMGVGTLASYGREGDVYRFYELNPSVLRVANSHFTFLKDSPARIETVLGDARLSLEREAPQRFDVLAVDAFSSDAIPMHLLTREALALYARHVTDDGIIALHVSNRYLELAPMVRRLAHEQGMRSVAVLHTPPKKTAETESIWVLVTRNDELATAMIGYGIGVELPLQPELRPWTDDYHNLLQVMR